MTKSLNRLLPVDTVLDCLVRNNLLPPDAVDVARAALSPAARPQCLYQAELWLRHGEFEADDQLREGPLRAYRREACQDAVYLWLDSNCLDPETIVTHEALSSFVEFLQNARAFLALGPTDRLPPGASYEDLRRRQDEFCVDDYSLFVRKVDALGGVNRGERAAAVEENAAEAGYAAAAYAENEGLVEPAGGFDLDELAAWLKAVPIPKE